MLAVAESPELDHPSSIVYFRVEEIDSARGELLSRGVQFDDEPHVIAKMPDHELLDDLLPRPRPEPARADVRSQT